MAALEMAHAVIKSHKILNAHTATMTHCATYANYEILKVLQILFSGVSRSVLPRPIVFKSVPDQVTQKFIFGLKKLFLFKHIPCCLSLYV